MKKTANREKILIREKNIERAEVLRKQGYTIKEISKELNVNNNFLYYWGVIKTNDPLRHSCRLTKLDIEVIRQINNLEGRIFQVKMGNTLNIHKANLSRIIKKLLNWNIFTKVDKKKYKVNFDLIPERYKKDIDK